MSLSKDYFSDYLSFRASAMGEKWAREREDKRRLLSYSFSKEMLREVADEEFVKAFTDALSSLWAMAVWKKREQHINQII